MYRNSSAILLDRALGCTDYIVFSRKTAPNGVMRRADAFGRRSNSGRLGRANADSFFGISTVFLAHFAASARLVLDAPLSGLPLQLTGTHDFMSTCHPRSSAAVIRNSVLESEITRPYYLVSNLTTVVQPPLWKEAQRSFARPRRRVFLAAT